jgi:glutamate-1-semialdehyde aminotransferase
VYDVAYPHHNLPPRLPADALRTLWVSLENRGTETWRQDPPDGRSVELAVSLDGARCTTLELPREAVRPGERVTISWTFRTPLTVGPHQLKLELVGRQRLTTLAAKLRRRLRGPYRAAARLVRTRLRWAEPALRSLVRALRPARGTGAETKPEAGSAASQGSVELAGATTLLLDFETTEAVPTSSSLLWEEAQAANRWFFVPSRGVSWSRDGPTYPLFARAAKGCRITDLEGRPYIDYLMGYGCALLGYAHERVQRAVAAAIDSGGVLSLAHHLEMEVARTLCEEIPCAEVVVFGKNGSDVCTAAVRLARVHTGRPKVLVCGYHGWQDWFAETRGFEWTGIPERGKPLVFHFPFNDLQTFLKLMWIHRGQVAAVMIEPAGPVEGDGLNGPLQDADPDFLAAVAAATRRAGALLIFDEIVTGFRYPGGSVQKATGVVPDLACFGKALSAGMPLSALVGRKAIIQASKGFIYYLPTFKSEVYSLAAAKAALAVYRECDVPGHVWAYGNQLKDGVNELCRRFAVPAELTGPPFRMVLAFREPDVQRLTMMRTLVQQELLKRGVLTFMGFMLPSYAHDAQALAETLEAFAHALRVVAEAAADDSFAARLEIPPICG